MATFNTTTCVWDVTGTQPIKPTVACYQMATFNTTTCVWDVTGTQPVKPTVACYETATFNTTTCVWDVTGTQPVKPTVACYETATFNTTTCVWDVKGTQPVKPTLACYQTVTFNTTTCVWDVTGTQPVKPTVACYQMATFNTTTCVWDVTGTQPVKPTLACYETATFNTTTCVWDVTGTQPVLTYQLPQEVCNGGNSFVNVQDIVNTQFPGVITTNGTWSINTFTTGFNSTTGIFASLNTPIGTYVVTYNNNDILCPKLVKVTIIVDATCQVLPCSNIIIYNAVTANGDGVNDFFMIDGVDCYSTNTVEIYNRWGVLVYTADGYNNKDVVFNGYSDGRVTITRNDGLPVGTYYYIFRYTNFDGTVKQKAGYLYLTR
jgi:gliding motility-associated-like protein